MEESSGIDIAVTNPQNTPHNLEDEKLRLQLFPCTLFDAEIVRKISQAFLPGIASACVDSTSGDLFRTPASVAPDFRREMVEYMTQRSESFVAENVIVEGGPEAVAFCHPYDVISDFVDDFASSKRNLFTRVSGWLLSDKRDDKIDDFVQEMEVNGFWLTDKRESVAHVLVKNIDFRNTFHCNASFGSAEELVEHVKGCGFRSVMCRNEGCNSVVAEANKERHDSVCPFKVIPCEQKCLERVMRREMDRHCVTVCPMRLVSCPFYAIGCQSTVPYCELEQHGSDDLRSHLVCVVQSIHKNMAQEYLKLRVDQIENASSPGQLKNARDMRSLTNTVKDLEAKLGPFKPNSESKNNEDNAETPSEESGRTESQTQDQVSS